ncbi:MAG TPA: glycosyltransferase [Anaerolineae bacterium]|nr:glycosyltransferase [Anaerolineae bacterium]
MSNSVRLGIVQDGPVAFDGENYWNSHPMGHYLERICAEFGRINLYAPVVTKDSAFYETFHEVQLDSDLIHVNPLRVGGGNIFSALWRQIKQIPLYWRNLAKNDWVLFFLPATFAFPGILVRQLQKLPYALYFGSDWEEIAPFEFRWKRWRFLLPTYLNIGKQLQNRAIREASFCLTAGFALKNKIARQGKPCFATVPRINLSLKELFFRPDTCLHQEVVCLFVGSLIPRKGLDCLLASIGLLREWGLPARLCIVGDGPLRSTLETQVKEQNLAGIVDLVGHIPNGPQLWQQYRESDIFVLPTRSEGFPRVLYEAMSQSLPIVTTNVSGIPYVMEHRRNALLVAPDETKSIANAITELMQTPALRQKLIIEGIKTVSEILRADPGEQLKSLVCAQSHK